MTDDERRKLWIELMDAVKLFDKVPPPRRGVGANRSVVLEFEQVTFDAVLSGLATVRKLLAVLADVEEKP